MLNSVNKLAVRYHNPNIREIGDKYVLVFISNDGSDGTNAYVLRRKKETNEQSPGGDGKQAALQE